MFPAPIGGLALPSEFGACILFAALYGLLFPLVLYRVYDRRSRTFLLLGTCLTVVDRTVLFSFRAASTQRANLQLSDGLLKYSQISFGLGAISIANDLVNLLRCLLVNPTYGYGEAGRADEAPMAHTKESAFAPPREGDVDRPQERRRARRFCSILGLTFLAANVPGIIAGGLFQKKNFGKEHDANRVAALRYASAAVSLFLASIITLAAAWSRKYQPRACHKAINTIFALTFLAGIVGVYRLSVMHHRTPSLDSTLPGTLNSPGAKASFYVLHIVPEYLAIAILLGFNTRKTFGTGAWGDWRGQDDTPKLIAKRKERQEKRAAKKAERIVEKGGVATSS
ncbi:hypothetical protein DFP72DRAFT_1060403 [Ephemerocybe angulata]|uniref:Uncharacterized protein n=1 Tax=Ephemerocybe angulata TaxID=980116 RepID=A0A8H6ICV9_9AGAR|nr:hypothetical protein DFP72DRAFT_1060403 [Tulosesus angulatus]